MKSYYYGKGEAVLVTFENGERKEIGKVKEMVVDLRTDNNVADYRHFPIEVNQYQSANFSFDIEPDSFLLDWLHTHKSFDDWFRQKYFKHVELVCDGYVTSEMKRTFFELQDKGYLFCPIFRQEIHPRLRAHIQFLTTMSVEAQWQGD